MAVNIAFTRTSEPHHTPLHLAQDSRNAATRLLCVDSHAHDNSLLGATAMSGLEQDEERKNPPGHATTPAGGESGGRLHGRLGGEESDRVSTVANDP
ncbi:hypothetical protein GCM10022384_64780 [Streptomyces marokkonensis]|uniref:Uncharacterized protein n=1 Tax=Streptomyces marokkonensis TaxID=324855 RepID=A0ABP7SED0_9ACTN